MTTEAKFEAASIEFCWGKEQLDLVKKAADAAGIPYQDFMKLAVYRRALAILRDVQLAKLKEAA